MTRGLRNFVKNWRSAPAFLSACTLLGPNRARRVAASAEVRPEEPEPIQFEQCGSGELPESSLVFRRGDHRTQYNAYEGLAP